MNTAATMTPVEMAKHIRGRLRISGVSARCRTFANCGRYIIQVNLPSLDATWTDDECATICLIAKVNGLTGANRGPIPDGGYLAATYAFEYLPGSTRYNHTGDDGSRG